MVAIPEYCDNKCIVLRVQQVKDDNNNEPNQLSRTRVHL